SIQRPAEHSDAAIYEIALQRAVAGSRTQPTEEDFLFAAAQLRPLGESGRELTGRLIERGLDATAARENAEMPVYESGEYGDAPARLLNRRLEQGVMVLPIRNIVERVVPVLRALENEPMFQRSIDAIPRGAEALVVASEQAGTRRLL